jgi:adenylate cyclase
MRSMIETWLGRLAAIGTLPTDTQDQRLGKAVLVFLTSLISIAAIFWGVMYFALGFPLSGAIPLGYSVISLTSLLIFALTKRYNFFRFSQLLLMLVLPFILQWSLGGFAAASVVIVWAFLAPMGALMFAGADQASRWFLAFLALTVISGMIDAPLTQQQPAHLPQIVVILFNVMNLGTVSAIVYVLLRYFVKQREYAQEQSERLLLNIRPSAIADRLKQNPVTIADEFQEVTVLFADIVDFTTMSANARAEQVVQMLNTVFSAFDELADKHGLEKIKTIGDAYMVVGGLPKPRADHAEAVAEMALDMLTVLEDIRAWNGDPIRVRIGINTGPVVAGVIGRKKFIYDLWGDAVNTASRMESHGLGGVIQVTETTYACLKDGYDFKDRGMISIKGKGEMRTYLLVGRKEQMMRDQSIESQ